MILVCKIIKMEIWRRNVRRRIEMGPSRSLINSPNYNFNDVICSVIPEYGNFSRGCVINYAFFAYKIDLQKPIFANIFCLFWLIFMTFFVKAIKM